MERNCDRFAPKIFRVTTTLSEKCLAIDCAGGRDTFGTVTLAKSYEAVKLVSAMIATDRGSFKRHMS